MSLLVMFDNMFLCLNSISFHYLLDIILSSLTTRSNNFLSRDLNELSLINYSLLNIPFNYLDPNVLTFTPTLKMVKVTHNHIPKNIIG